MSRRHVPSITLAAAAMSLAFCASGEVLYKLIDRNGKVTYSEEKPKNFDGQVIRLDIDPNANTATFPKGEAVKPKQPIEGETPRARPRAETKPGKADRETRIEAARERLQRAQAAFQQARDNPPESDMTILGNKGAKGGGVRFVPTEEYQRKLDLLEQAVKSAEEDLRAAERGD